jgi:hypothetical protein
MYGVPVDDLYGPPARRLLNINYDTGYEAHPTTNDMPDGIWIGFGAFGLASAVAGGWVLRRRGSPRTFLRAGQVAEGGDTALAPWLAGRPGPSGQALSSRRPPRWR